MSPHPSALLLAALLVCAPSALAGTEEDPDVPDVRDHDNPTLDFLAGWLETAPGGVQMTIKVAKAELRPVDKFYAFAFDLKGVHTVAFIAYDGEGRVHSDIRSNRNLPAPEAFSEALEDVEFRPGAPAYFSAFIPWGATAGFSPGNVLVDLYAGTGTYDRRTGEWDDADGRETAETYVLERTVVPLLVQRNPMAFVAGSVVLVAAVGGGIAYWLHRRRTG